VTRLTRTKLKFRYPGDPAEVKIELSREEAYEYANAMIAAGAPNGTLLKAFLEDSENTDADVIRARHE
jgi:hypothetical protein